MSSCRYISLTPPNLQTQVVQIQALAAELVAKQTNALLRKQRRRHLRQQRSVIGQSATNFTRPGRLKNVDRSKWVWYKLLRLDKHCPLFKTLRCFFHVVTAQYNTTAQQLTRLNIYRVLDGCQSFAYNIIIRNTRQLSGSWQPASTPLLTLTLSQGHQDKCNGKQRYGGNHRLSRNQISQI